MARTTKADKDQAGDGASGAVHRIVADGNITGDAVQDLENRLLAEMVRAKGRPVVLDLKGVETVDARGIMVCIGLHKECLANGKPLVIEAGADLFRLFKTLKLTKVIDIREGTAS